MAHCCIIRSSASVKVKMLGPFIHVATRIVRRPSKGAKRAAVSSCPVSLVGIWRLAAQAKAKHTHSEVSGCFESVSIPSCRPRISAVGRADVHLVRGVSVLRVVAVVAAVCGQKSVLCT